MKPIQLITVIVATAVGTAGCSRARTGVPTPAPADAAVSSETLTVAAALAQAGYTAVPMRQDGGRRTLAATIATTPVDLVLDSGSPFDLRLDSSFARGARSGIWISSVLSSYWAFTPFNGRWAVVDRLGLGGSQTTTLYALEARIEPSPSPTSRAELGATALMSQGAIVDYATDTLYLLTPRDSRDSSAAAPAPQVVRHPSVRIALEQAGHYRTFLALMHEAGMAALLDTLTPGAVSDSNVWLGLRIRPAELSGVGGMPPNDIHVQLTRAALNRRLLRPGRHTAFVPTDAAFAQLPAETLRALRADTARLARLLRLHLYPGVAIDTADMRTLIRGVAQPGREAFGFHVLGSRIDVDRLTNWEEGRVADRATIVEPDLRAANGMAHGIDRVLGLPAAPSPLAAALVRQGYVGIPLHRREDGNGYLVHATVNGIPAQLTVATGAELEVALDRRWIERLPASQRGNYVIAFDSIGLGVVDVTTADFSDSIRAAERQGYRPENGVLGSRLLAKYQARLDYAAGVLYLRR